MGGSSASGRQLVWCVGPPTGRPSAAVPWRPTGGRSCAEQGDKQDAIAFGLFPPRKRPCSDRLRFHRPPPPPPQLHKDMPQSWIVPLLIIDREPARQICDALLDGRIGPCTGLPSGGNSWPHSCVRAGAPYRSCKRSIVHQLPLTTRREARGPKLAYRQHRPWPQEMFDFQTKKKVDAHGPLILTTRLTLVLLRRRADFLIAASPCTHVDILWGAKCCRSTAEMMNFPLAN